MQVSKSFESPMFQEYVRFCLKDNHVEQFKTSRPFDHIVIDDFLTSEAITDVHKQFVPGKNWYAYDNPFENKIAMDRVERFPWSIQNLLLFLNSSPFVRFLEKLSGVPHLITDPHYRGGGCHAIPPGGHLDVHEDFSIHPDLKLFRRLNVLIYLNEFPSGGELELWNREMTECVHKIEPLFNRCVIFRTDQKSNHGHPEKWTGNGHRRSIATYYYTATHENSDMIQDHSTLFKKRPQDQTNEEIEALRKLRNKGRLTHG